jgi:hypothetical protein
MTYKERVVLAKRFEKPGHKSKKFVGFIFMELLLAFLAVYALEKQPTLGWPLAMFMFGIVVSMGSIALVFNGYQAKLDMFVRGMAMAGQAPISLMETIFGVKRQPADDVPVDEEVSSDEEGEA